MPNYQFDVPSMPAFDPSSAARGFDMTGLLGKLRMQQPAQQPWQQSPMMGQMSGLAPQFRPLPFGGQGSMPPDMSRMLSGYGDAPMPGMNQQQPQLPAWLLAPPTSQPQYQSQLPSWLLQPPGSSSGAQSSQPMMMGGSGSPWANGISPSGVSYSGGQQPLMGRAGRTPDWSLAAGMPQQRMMQPQQQPADLTNAYMLPAPPGGSPPMGETIPQIAALLQLLSVVANGGGMASSPAPPMNPGAQGPLPPMRPGQINTATTPGPIYNNSQMGGAMNALTGMQARMPQMPGIPGAGGQQSHLNDLMGQYGSQAAGQFANTAIPANAQQSLGSYGQAVDQSLGGASYLNNLMGSQLDLQGGQRNILMSILQSMLGM